MPKISHEDFEATKFLGGVAGAKYPFIKKIAMCSPRERAILAYLEVYKIVQKNQELLEKLDKNPEDPKIMDQVITRILDPVFVKIGQANYKMGEISHISAKIGSTRRRFSTKDLPTFIKVVEKVKQSEVKT